MEFRNGLSCNTIRAVESQKRGDLSFNLLSSVSSFDFIETESRFLALGTDDFRAAARHPVFHLFTAKYL